MNKPTPPSNHDTTPVRLVRTNATHFDGWPRLVETHQLDPSQTTATTARGPLIHIYGAPGTGKTTVAVHSVLHRIRNNHRTPTECMLLTSSRVTATHARREVTRLLGTTTQRPLAASMQAFGFSILTRLARLNNTPPPRLLDGAEQDVILGELLTGHTTGHAPAPNWPHDITEALTTRGFRSELRDLIMRAVEYGISPEELAHLGNQHNEPAWTAAADVLREYDNVTALSRPGAYDPSWILGAAAGALLDNPTNINLLNGGIRTLIIDDAQELTAAAATLLNTLHHNGTELVLIGDPDTATQTFRGADPHLFTNGWNGLTPTTTHTLNTRHRPNHAIATVTTHITQNIGVTGTATHRHATPQPGPEPATNTPPIDIIIANNTSAEEAHITALLRREHLLNGREWSDMAVIVRGSTRTAALRRAFNAAGIPTDIAGARLPLREETPVRTLLAIYEVAIHAAWAAAHNPTPENPDTTPQPTPQHLTTADLLALDETLTSHLLQSDTVTARRARRALTHHERTNGGTRTTPELLAHALLDPTPPPPHPDLAPITRLRTALHAALHAITITHTNGRPTWHPNTTCHTILWAIWNATNAAPLWRDTALNGTTASARADRDLDAVVALFAAADAYTTRLPGSGPLSFLEHLLSQDVAADTLAARGQRGRQVTLTTPAGAVGREWGLVIIAGLQEGVWPDTRLRGSLLGSERLVDILTNRGTNIHAQLIDVLHDEARLFALATSRARQRLIITATSNEDEQPSNYCELVRQAIPNNHPDTPTQSTPTPRAMSMTGLVGELRRRLTETTDPHQRNLHAQRLAHLARLGVPGAHPDTWWPDQPISTNEPVLPPQSRIRISPSKIQTYTECPLRWFATTAGGEATTPQTTSALGTLIHDIAARYENDYPAMSAELDRLWPHLNLPDGWTSQRLHQQAQHMISRLANYQNTSTNDGWQPVAKETDINVPIGRADIRGRIDRLERNPQGQLRIIDFKTGATKPTDADITHHAQLATYQIALEAGALNKYGSGSAGAALVHIGKAGLTNAAKIQAQPPLNETEDSHWAHQLIEEISNGMTSNTFPAHPGPWCRVCSHHTICPTRNEGGTQ